MTDLLILCRYPNTNAMSVKRGGEWKAITYKEYYEQVRTMAKAFIKLGLEPFHGVCILGFNSPEWFMSDLAAIFAGWVPSRVMLFLKSLVLILDKSIHIILGYFHLEY